MPTTGGGTPLDLDWSDILPIAVLPAQPAAIAPLLHRLACTGWVALQLDALRLPAWRRVPDWMSVGGCLDFESLDEDGGRKRRAMNEKMKVLVGGGEGWWADSPQTYTSIPSSLFMAYCSHSHLEGIIFWQQFSSPLPSRNREGNVWKLIPMTAHYHLSDGRQWKGRGAAGKRREQNASPSRCRIFGRKLTGDTSPPHQLRSHHAGWWPE